MLDVEGLISEKPPRSHCSWTKRDSTIYNLGIGMGDTAYTDPSWLPYVREEEGAAFPTMVAVLGAHNAGLVDERFGLDMSGVLHGEEWLTLNRSLPPEGNLAMESGVEGVWDRGEGRGAILTMRRDLLDTENGEVVASARTVIMARKNGGFGGTMDGAPKLEPVPERAADGSIAYATHLDQALLYRLSGDRHQLHSHPEFARAAGFDRPILMGLCSLGYAARAICEPAGGASASARMRRFGARFSGVVFPGETLRFDYWQIDDGEYAFCAFANERNAKVLDGGRASFAPD